MTTSSARRPLPGSGLGRLVGIGIALGAVFVLSRLPIGQAPPAPAAPATVVDAAPALDPVGTLGLRPPGERVAFWEARVVAGGSHLDLIHLADAYLERSRATGDLDDLQRAATALDRAAATAPNPQQVAVRRAQVAFALHDFDGAMRRADAVLRDNPTDLAALGVAGDARLETGDIAGARARYLQLVELAPSPPAWSRIGRLAFLTGDLERAERLVALAAAVSLEEGAPDAVAFYQFQLGDLRRAGGDVAGAESAYAAALDALPDYVPAMAGMAAVHEARGERGQAVQLLERAAARLPLPELVAALGDLYALDGDHERAAGQYAIVDEIGRLSAAAGSVHDRQLVIIAADHERDLANAVARARAELAVRDDIYGHDALAWALYRAGDIDEAARHAEAALSLGTPDPRLAYHAGLIAAARGERERAEELLQVAVDGLAFLPPLQAEAAREALTLLTGGPAS